MKINGAPATHVERPRVAFISRNFGSRFGGAEAYAENLLTELATTHDVHVFCQQWASALNLPHTVAPRIQGLPRWLNLLHFTLKCWRLTRNFDVVHTHENSWLGNVHGVHVMPVRYARLHHRCGWRRWLGTWTSPRWLAYLAMEAGRYRHRPGHRLVAVSPLIAAQIKTAYPHATPPEIIPPAVRLPVLCARDDARRLAREQLNLPADGPLAILIANDPMRKGFGALLRALPLATTSLGVIVVGGEPQVAPRIRALAEQAGMGNRVHVWPAQRDVAPFYAAADLCVFPTTGDAFGMVPLEAMSYGLPVILSGKRYCGFAEFIQDGEDALVLDDPDNAADIAAAIDRLLSDPTLYTQLAKAGLALAGHMSWPQAAARYAALYHEVVNETQPARQSYAKG